MKKCIIILNLIFYTTLLNQWNFIESQPTSSSSGTTDTDTKESTDTVTVTLDIEKNKDTNEFNYNKNGDFRTYTPKSNYVFNKIVKKNLEIWTAKPNDHGLKVVLMGSKKDEKHLAILLKSHNFVLLRKTGKNQPWEDITSKKYDITNLKFFGESDTELSNSDYSVTLSDLSFTYKFKDANKCKKIKYADEEVWNHTDDPKFSDIKSFSLYLPKDQFIVKNQSDNTKELTKATVTHVTLDIDKSKDTNEFNYKKNGDFRTYRPKDNNLFNKVSQGTKDVWQSKDNVFGTLVRTLTSDNVKYLAILLDNDMFTLFNEESGDWKDITSTRPDITNLKFIGESDKELSNSDYKVDLVDYLFTYIFNTGVKCKKIKLGDEEVWKHTDDTEFAEIKSFSLGLVSNSFILKNLKDEVKKIEKEFKAPTTPTPTSVTSETTPTPVTPATPTPTTGTPASQTQSGTPAPQSQ